MAMTFSMANWSIPEGCAEKYGPSAWKCILAQVVYQFVEAPIFVLNSALDFWQTNYILGRTFLDGIGPSGAQPIPGWESCTTNVTTCSSSQVRTMNGYIDDFQASMQAG